MPIDRPLILAGHLLRTDTCADVQAPWDARLLARVSLAGPAEASFAARASDRAFRVTRRLPARRRAAVLAGLAEWVRANRAELAALARDEGGKPIALTTAEVGHAVALLECAADETLLDEPRGSPRDQGRSAWTRAVPRGPVLACTSAYAPLAGVAGRIAAAVGAGCPIVIRPAFATPLCALALGQALVAAGWPVDAVSVLPCDDAVADRLLADPRFATVSFPASARTCWRLHPTTGQRAVLVEGCAPVSLVVEPDADLDLAVRVIARGAYAHAGQLRAAAHRVLVHHRVYDDVRERLLAAVRSLPCGDPARDDVVCGPLVDAATHARVLAWIRHAELAGAGVLEGGVPRGSVVTPGVLEAAGAVAELLAADTRVLRGPVVVLESYPSLEVATRRLNRRPGEVGLFTRSIRKVWDAFERLDAGPLFHDTHPDLAPVEPEARIDELREPRRVLVSPTTIDEGGGRTLPSGPLPGEPDSGSLAR